MLPFACRLDWSLFLQLQTQFYLFLRTYIESFSLVLDQLAMKRAERVWHASNWLRRELANYGTGVVKQFLSPDVEAARLEQFFRLQLSPDTLLCLYEHFVEKPNHFQMFIYIFWAQYWDTEFQFWKCVDANASVQMCCERFWNDVQSLPVGMMPCPVVWSKPNLKSLANV